MWFVPNKNMFLIATATSFCCFTCKKIENKCLKIQNCEPHLQNTTLRVTYILGYIYYTVIFKMFKVFIFLLYSLQYKFLQKIINISHYAFQYVGRILF